MTTRTDKLQRLQVASPCQSSWEAMRGDGRRRHCLQCDKQVYDFSQLTPREIAGLIEATGGKLCGRLTRDAGGRLVTLPPPPVVAEPFAPRRVSPLAAGVVAAVLGLSGGAWGVGAAAVAPATEQGAGKEPGGDRPQRAGDAGSSLTGRLTTEGGEPIPDAEVKVYGQFDQQERVGSTDAEGRFSFASLPAGIYQVQAAVGGRFAAYQADVLLQAGEKRQVGLTVAAELWQAIVAGEPEPIFAGGISYTEEPLRAVFDEAGLVVLGVAGKSVVVQREEYSWEVRTDISLSSVLKGETGERVISVFHEQMPDEEPASLLQPGDKVLAFLEPREMESGHGSDGYVATDPRSGLRELSDAEIKAYGQRLEALERITRKGPAHPAAVLEWLVATAEDPVTRGEAVGELRAAVGRLDQQAGQHDTPIDRYAERLRDVLADFLATGGKPQGEIDSALLAAFLTDAHRERLTTALLRTPRATSADLDLYELVSLWHDDRLVPWLTGQLAAAEPADGEGRRMMTMLAETLGDEGLAALQAEGEQKIQGLEQELDGASGEAAGRLDLQLAAAEKELRKKFVEALGARLHTP
jgi:hypothetical protein